MSLSNLVAATLGPSTICRVAFAFCKILAPDEIPITDRTMPTFTYRALDKKGKYANGRLDAGSVQEVRQKLRDSGLQPIEVNMKSVAMGSGGAQDAMYRPVKAVNLDKLRLTRSKADVLALAFLEKLHQLIENGLPLGDAVKSLHNRLREPTLHAVAESLWRDLSEGATLAEAMRRRPVLFEPTLSSMIEAGEATGSLESILANVNDLLRARIQLRKNILSALSYPAAILFVAFGVLLFVLFYLMPRVQEMMDSMGGELSLAAKAVIFFAHNTLTFGPFIIGAVALGVLILHQWRKTEDGRMSTDRLLLRIPIIREIIANSELSRLANLASILLESGVDTTDALKLLEKGLKNEDLRVRFRAARGLINDGSSFSDALQEYNILVDMDADVLAVSENTGSLVKGFKNIYHNRYNNLETQMKHLTAVTATGALGFVFILVGMLVIGVVSSIMALSNSVLGG